MLRDAFSPQIPQNVLEPHFGDHWACDFSLALASKENYAKVSGLLFDKRRCNYYNIVIMATTDDQKTITMMQLRSKPGTLLDYVFYRNESLLVEKAGEPRAVIVSLQDYEQLKQARQQARTRFTERLRQSQDAFQSLSEEEKQQLTDEASAYARTPQST